MNDPKRRTEVTIETHTIKTIRTTIRTMDRDRNGLDATQFVIGQIAESLGMTTTEVENRMESGYLDLTDTESIEPGTPIVIKEKNNEKDTDDGVYARVREQNHEN